MCGLSGVMSSTISWQEEGMFKDLLSVSSLRGFEGSGVIVSQKKAFKSNPAIRCVRTPAISGSLANSKALAELLKPSVNAIIGHARWPTKGGNEIQSIHPHRAGHIIGVHNGTLNRVAGEDVKDQSDSKMLFESFAKNGVQETIKKTDGAYALVWIDEAEQTLNFLRNTARPLFFKNVGWNKNISTVYWASEREMLNFVFKRTYKGENTWDTYLPVDTWFKYPLDVKHMIVPEDVIENVKPEAKVYPAVSYYRGHHHPNRSTLFDVDGSLNDDLSDIPWVRHDNRDKPLLLPSPNVSPLSMAQRKKNLRAAKKEAADRLKKQGKFHNVQWNDEVQDYIPRLTKEENDRRKAVAKPSGNMAEVVEQLGRRTTSDDGATRYQQLAGKPCAFCGEPASPGDRVYTVGSSDLGDKTFVCHDCGTYPGNDGFCDADHLVTVSP